MIFGKSINRFYGKYWYLVITGVVALLFVNYFQLLVPDVIGDIIDGLNAIIYPDKTNAEPLTLQALILFIKELFIVMAVMFTGRFVWRITIFGLGVRVETDLRDEMFRHSEKLSREYYNTNKTGALMALFTNDLQTIKSAFGQGTVMMVDAIFLGTLSFVKMFRLDPVLSIISALPLLILAMFGGVIGKALRKRFTLRQEAFFNLSDFTQENFSGITVIKAFVKEQKEYKRFAEINKDNVDKNIKLVHFGMIFNSVVSILIGAVIVIIIGYGGYLVYQDPAEFTVGN